MDDLVEFVKHKIANDNSMKPHEKDMANVAVDAVADTIVKIGKMESHFARIAAALEANNQLMRVVYNIPVNGRPV